jgi:hypothetical protein
MLEKNNRKVIKDVSVLPATGETRFIYHNTTNGYNYLWNEVEGIFIKVEQATTNFASIVYVNTTTPTTATIFDDVNPPVVNDNSLKTDPANLYIATDNSTWTYKISTNSYSTYTVPQSTPFYLANTTTDAGSNKTASIYRTGNVGIGTANPTTNLDVVGGFNLRNTVGAQGTNYAVEINTNGNAPRIDWVFNGGYMGQFSSDANDFFLKNSKLSTGGFRFTTNPSGAAVERLTILNNGNVGISNSSPNSKLEVSGSFGAAIRSSATSLTTLSTDYTIVMTAATTVATLETPSSTTNRRILNIKNASTGNITITGNIDGTTQTLTLTQKESRTFHSNGSTWWII